MRGLLAPLHVVKIKAFDTDRRIVYSTDRKIIGQVDAENAKLLTALNGTPTSKYEKTDAVWDLDDEQRFDVDLVETYVPVRDENGRIIGSFEIYKDITAELTSADHTLAAVLGVLLVTLLAVFAPLSHIVYRSARGIAAAVAALRDSERRYRSVVETAGDVIVCLDGEARILEWNGAAERLWGYARYEALGQSYPQLCVSPDRREAAAGQIARALGGEAIDGVEGPIRTRDGQERTLLWNFTPLPDADGRPVAALGTGHDITLRIRAQRRQRKLEARIQQARKLEGLGALAGGVAHDFNNLLMIVLNNAEVGLRRLGADSPAHQNLQNVKDAVVRATELTAKMLAYAGDGHFAIDSIDLNALIEDATDLLRESIPPSIALNRHLAPDLPPVLADAAQMRRIVASLVTNATEALGDRAGTITITTDAVLVGATEQDDDVGAGELPEGPYARLRVADTGCGMNEQTISQLFDPFFSTKFIGRGLSLSAALGIVRRHRGTILVDSEPDQGATFTVLLPLTEPPAPGEPDPSEIES